MSDYVPAQLRRFARERASGCCEYCLLHEDDCLLPHEPDHIIAIKHRGKTTEENLAWTCFVCNRGKGSDIASVDDASGAIVPLFSPRVHVWADHFELGGDGTIIGKTPVGRATVDQFHRVNDGSRLNREVLQ